MATPNRHWNRLRACLHRLCGRAWFGMRRLGRARPHFEQVVRLLGEDYSAHVYLAKIAFLAGDYAGWRRELRQAYLANPAKFSKLANRMTNGDELGPQLAGTGIDSRLPGAAPTVRGPRPGTAVGDAEPVTVDAQRMQGEIRALQRDLDDPKAEEILQELMDVLGPTKGDDCGNAKERHRFADLGPITAQELRACDLDALARRFGDESKSA